MRENELKVKVETRERLNTQINQIVPQILEDMKRFVGKKVLTRAGLAKEFGAMMEKYIGWQKVLPELMIFGRESKHFFYLTFKTSSQIFGKYGSIAVYQESTVNLGVLDNDILVNIVDWFPMKTGYTYEGVKEILDKIDRLERELSDLKVSIPFSE